MSIEEQLKQYILDRYKSVREFTIAIDIPYTTLDTLFKKGVQRSSVSNVVKICRALHISADALADGRIVPYYGIQDTTGGAVSDLSPEELTQVNQFADFIRSQRA